MMVTRTAVAAWWSMCVSAVLQGMRGDPVAIDATPLESRFSSPDPRLPLRFQTSWAFKAARRWLTRGTVVPERELNPSKKVTSGDIRVKHTSEYRRKDDF
ncbi:hypothetical protein EDD17DRAFT_1650855 [Pisolithus thermaeus]|nr:hypothetical protein EDD17DRAFT_1650855 [Pisolithus thermaeus]